MGRDGFWRQPYLERGKIAILARPLKPLASLLVGYMLQHAPSSRLASGPNVSVSKFRNLIPLQTYLPMRIEIQLATSGAPSATASSASKGGRPT